MMLVNLTPVFLIGLPLLLLGLILLVIEIIKVKNAKKQEKAQAKELKIATSEIEHHSKITNVKSFFAKFYLYGILLLMYLPILVLIVYSFTPSDQLGVWTNFSFELYGDLFENDAIMSATLNTLLIALVSATLATILGTIGAIGSYYAKPKYRKTIETMNQLPVVNAEIVMALSLALVFKVLNTSYSFMTLLVGHLVLTTAFVYLNVKPKLVQMDPNIYEAALDLGATPRSALLKVVLPEIMPGIFSGFLISITLSLDDFVITQYLKEPSFETISTYLQKIIAKHPIPPEVRALSTILFVIVLSVVVGITVYSNKKAFKKAGLRGGK